MKFILINAGGKAEVVEIEGDTIDYLKMKEYLRIESPLTVVDRKVGDTYYDLWCDDEGLLKPECDRILSGVLLGDGANGRITEILVGNIIIARHDGKGNSIGLSERDIDNIMKPLNIIETDEFQSFIGTSAEKDLIINDYKGFGAITVKAHSQWLKYGI